MRHSSSRIYDIIKNEFLGWHRWEILWLLFTSTAVGIIASLYKDSLTAITAAICGISASVLTGKGKLSAYIIGGTGRVLYALIALKACFYGEVMLNLLYFVPMEFYGIYVWSRNMDQGTHEVKKKSMNRRQTALLGITVAAATASYAFWLRYLGGKLPLLDSFTNAVSIIAMIVTIKRYAQTWILWLMVNTVSIIMWTISCLHGTGSPAILLMWCIYLANSVIMLIKWMHGAEK